MSTPRFAKTGVSLFEMARGRAEAKQGPADTCPSKANTPWGVSSLMLTSLERTQHQRLHECVPLPGGRVLRIGTPPPGTTVQASSFNCCCEFLSLCCPTGSIDLAGSWHAGYQVGSPGQGPNLMERLNISTPRDP